MLRSGPLQPISVFRPSGPALRLVPQLRLAQHKRHHYPSVSTKYGGYSEISLLEWLQLMKIGHDEKVGGSDLRRKRSYKHKHTRENEWMIGLSG